LPLYTKSNFLLHNMGNTVSDWLGETDSKGENKLKKEKKLEQQRLKKLEKDKLQQKKEKTRAFYASTTFVPKKVHSGFQGLDSLPPLIIEENDKPIHYPQLDEKPVHCPEPHEKPVHCPEPHEKPVHHDTCCDHDHNHNDTSCDHHHDTSD